MASELKLKETPDLWAEFQTCQSCTRGQLHRKYIFRCNMLRFCTHAATIKLFSRCLIYIWCSRASSSVSPEPSINESFLQRFEMRLPESQQQNDTKKAHHHRWITNYFWAALNRLTYLNIKHGNPLRTDVNHCCALKQNGAFWIVWTIKMDNWT